MMVVEVVLQPWTEKKTGRFVHRDPGADDAQIHVVPVHLIRSAVGMSTSVETTKVTRKVMVQLHTVCRAYHVCFGIFVSTRQYYIKLGSREGCVCPYHLRWEYMVLGIKQHWDSLLAGSKILEAEHRELALVLCDPSAFRKAIVCERTVGSEYSKTSCVAASCSSCSDLQRVVAFFGSAKSELIFGTAGFKFSEIVARDLKTEDAIGLEEVQKTQVDGICYKRLTKTLHWRKDGTQKENKEFLEREVSLLDFWQDFKSFFPDLLAHHDLSKSQGREFASLKSFNPQTREAVLQKGEVRGVIDFIQRLTIKRGNKETQQEFFAQNGCTLLVLSLTMHIDDVCNLTEMEKKRMKAVLEIMGKPPLIREELYYISHDPERGQAFVQHALNDASDYLRGDGRWARTKEDCSDKRKKAWVEDPYYNGRGAGKVDTFSNVHMWSDGCCADFKCATLLLWLSTISANTNVIWHWNWFCSCHGKTDECDAGGGALKRAVDGIELSGVGAFFDHALAIVRYCQDKLRHPYPAQPDAWFFNGGKGVYRRWYHHIPSRGQHSIKRQIAQAAKDSNLTLQHNVGTPFPISSMHRAMRNNGYRYHLHCSTRSCYSCLECKQGRYTQCVQSEADKKSGANWLLGRCSHELKEVIVQPRSVDNEQYSYGCLLQRGNSVFDGAEAEDILALESQTDSEPFWLVRVVEKHSVLGREEVWGEWGANIVCKRGAKAIKVTKLMVTSSQATNTFREDTERRQFFVPAGLLRMVVPIQKDYLVVKEGRTSSRCRAAVRAVAGDSGSDQLVRYYELGKKGRHEVSVSCRANDLPAPQEPAAAVVMVPAAAAAARTVAAVVVPPAVRAAATAPVATGKVSAGDLKAMPSSRLQRTEKSARTAFRNSRAAQVDGQTVEEAQKQQVPNRSGDMVRYMLGDLAYDINGGLLVLTGGSS
jgi:hypothetical protein